MPQVIICILLICACGCALAPLNLPLTLQHSKLASRSNTAFIIDPDYIDIQSAFNVAINSITTNDNFDVPLVASQADSDLLVLSIALNAAPRVVAFNELESGLQVLLCSYWITPHMRIHNNMPIGAQNFQFASLH